MIPLAWLLSVTMTAGVQKIFHADPRIGFLSQARTLNEKLPALEQAQKAVESQGDAKAIEAARKAVATNRTLHFNNVLDAGVAGVFLVLVVMIVLLSVREWILLIARRRLAVLHETEPVWLPDYVTAEGKPLRLFGLFALAFALARELSGEAALDRARQVAHACDSSTVEPSGAMLGPNCVKEAGGNDVEVDRGKLFAKCVERRFNGINRCC